MGLMGADAENGFRMLEERFGFELIRIREERVERRVLRLRVRD